MDSTAQIKNNLIARIKNSADLDFLKALQTIFDSSEQSLYNLTAEQQRSIEISRSEIDSGGYIKNDELLSKTKAWLKKK